MVEQNSPKIATPPAGKSPNFFRRMVIIGAGGVFSGATILFFYLAILLPAFSESARRIGIISLFIAPVAFTINYIISMRRSKRLVEWMKKDAKGAPIDEQLWHDARTAAMKLPRLSAAFSFILWPSSMLTLATIMFFTGRFGWHETILVGISGALVGPMNAMTYFYGVRSVMNQALKRLAEYPFVPQDIQVTQISLKFKLVFSYSCLVVAPMLFAVLLDRHQGDKIVTEQRTAKVEANLSEAVREWQKNMDVGAINKYLSKNSIPSSEYFVMDSYGNTILGTPSFKLKKQVLAKIKAGNKGTVYLHTLDKWLDIKTLPGKDGFLFCAFRRLDGNQGFWARNWVVVFLLVLLGGFGCGLALEASRDILRSVDEMMNCGKHIQNGVFTIRGNYLVDDELGLLGELVNKMTDGIQKQLEISNRMVADIRVAIERLGKESAGVYKVVADQHLGVQDQLAGLTEAQAVSGQITDTARSIQEKAGSIENMAGQTSVGCGSGRSVLQEASGGMRLIGSGMDDISRRMVELSGHFERIVEIVALIEEISDRTNLLALNASLEAVGAGAVGKRFAVVAQEVRRLADKTTQSTTKILSLFDNIKESNRACMTAINQGNDRVNDGLTVMQRLELSLGEISKHANDTSEAVAQIHLMTSQQTTSCMQMQETISDVANSSKSMDEGAEITEESMKSLNDLASSLRALVERNDLT